MRGLCGIGFRDVSEREWLAMNDFESEGPTFQEVTIALALIAVIVLVVYVKAC